MSGVAPFDGQLRAFAAAPELMHLSAGKRRAAIQAASALAQNIPASEELYVFFYAVSDSADVLVAATDQTIRLFDLGSGAVIAQFRVAEMSVPQVRRKLGMRSWATLTVNTQNVLDFDVGGRSWRLRRPIPFTEATRFIQLAAGKLSTRPALATFDELAVYPSVLVVEGGRRLPLSHDVTAAVEQAGNVTATRGRNLATKAAAGAVFGPLGLVLAGNAREHVIDTRELYLLVDGPDWTYSRSVAASRAGQLREFAHAIGLAARQLEPSTPTEQIASGSIGEELERLIALRDRGELSVSEYEALKARIVGADPPYSS